MKTRHYKWSARKAKGLASMRVEHGYIVPYRLDWSGITCSVCHHYVPSGSTYVLGTHQTLYRGKQRIYICDSCLPQDNWLSRIVPPKLRARLCQLTLL